VHSGFIKKPSEAKATLTRATEICRRLVNRVIELKCEVVPTRVEALLDSVPVAASLALVQLIDTTKASFN
jgi:hypothetical protein